MFNKKKNPRLTLDIVYPNMRDKLLVMGSKMSSTVIFIARGWRLVAPKEE